MAKEKLVVISTSDLTNNCPKCFNQELKLTFYQKHTYGALFHKITGEIIQAITCNTCKSTIYPVDWTDDIERVFEYYKKAINPEKKSLKYTSLFYGLILFFIVATSILIYLGFFSNLKTI